MTTTAGHATVVQMLNQIEHLQSERDKERAYNAELTDDLKAARAVIADINLLFIAAQMDEDCQCYTVDASAFNAIQDAINLLRIKA